MGASNTAIYIYLVNRNAVMKDLIELYCKRRGIPEPHSNTEVQKVLTRMKAVGLISEDEIKEVRYDDRPDQLHNK
jgi:hypothetical protein